MDKWKPCLDSPFRHVPERIVVAMDLPILATETKRHLFVSTESNYGYIKKKITNNNIHLAPSSLRTCTVIVNSDDAHCYLNFVVNLVCHHVFRGVNYFL